MSGESWLWIGLLVFLILCCAVPMLFMSRRGRRRGGANESNGRNHQSSP